jgi:hypothetical protein
VASYPATLDGSSAQSAYYVDPLLNLSGDGEQVVELLQLEDDQEESESEDDEY